MLIRTIHHCLSHFTPLFKSHKTNCEDVHLDLCPSVLLYYIHRSDKKDTSDRLAVLFDDHFSVFNTATDEGGQLVNILLDLMLLDNLCLSAARLLFSMYSKNSVLLSSASDVHLVTDTTKEFLLKVIGIVSMDGNTSPLHNALHGELIPEDVPDSLDILDDLCHHCVSPQDDTEPSPCHQAILYSSGEPLQQQFNIFYY